jgi:hypothetical protein
LVWLDIAGRHRGVPHGKCIRAFSAGLLAALFSRVEQSFARRPELRERLDRYKGATASL